MAQVQVTNHLNASPESLWAVVSNLSRWGDWFTIHDSWVTEPPETLTPGTKLTAKISVMGMTNKIDWTVQEIDAPRKLVMEGAGMMGVKTIFGFIVEPASEGGSNFTVESAFEGAMVTGAMAKQIETAGASQLEGTLRKIEQLAAAEA
ncbi:type II toxin-antitoxin system Rv0910 family toxin [Aldersonia kunmingensis]|uniref:type II toxin-antitoxin system Rv0910 family toxin n=1 Tax=Aldersonia kunmingensis TaxID=408066 RepID=UPI00082DE07A|nr:SRPBCC family protein [Aldersonia kunmingensis]